MSLFSSNATPIGQITLSNTHEGDSIAYSGGWVAVSSSEANAVWLVQTSTGRLLRLAQPEGWLAALGFSPDGRELWLVMPQDQTLLKYALP